MMKINFVTDPLVTTMGAVRPAILLAREFHKKGYQSLITTPRSDRKIAEQLRENGVTVKEVGPYSSLVPLFPTFDAWLRSMMRPKKIPKDDDDEFVVNTSSCIIAPADVYYGQGPMTRTLIDTFAVKRYADPIFHLFVKKILEKPERKLAHEFAHSTDLFVANSMFCASMYREWGLEVNEVIYPPLDCSFFNPSTKRPASDYVLTTLGTFGKEGDIRIIKKIADCGIPMKIFGEAMQVPGPFRKHENIRFVGRVTDAELRDLYSNALFTLFAFSHEPFGYVPVESMACGTPVLTFNRQGPSETVSHGVTGWVAESSWGLVKIAKKIWNAKYPHEIRTNCTKRAEEFDIQRIFNRWARLLKNELQQITKERIRFLAGITTSPK